MAARGTTTNEQIRTSGLGTGQVAERLVQVIGSRHGYSVVATGPNRFRFARTYRDPWVVPVAVVAALPSFGLGLLLLRVKRTESCSARVVEDREGVSVELDGFLRTDALQQLRAVLNGGRVAPTAPAPPRAAVAPTPLVRGDTAVTWHWSDDDDGRTFDGDGAGLGVAPTARGVLSLVLGDGRTIEVERGGVIGRDPIDDPDLPGGQRVILGAPSVSKTHLSFRAAPGGLSIRDRASTNGSTVTAAGVQSPCPAHVWVPAPIGSVVSVGDVSFTVVDR